MANQSLLISLPRFAPEALEKLLPNLAEAFPGEDLVIAIPDPALPPPAATGTRLVGYKPTVQSTYDWALTAADFLNAYELTRQYDATALLHLGPCAESLAPAAIRALADSVRLHAADLAVPRYDLAPTEALLTASVLYPLTRTLFGPRVRFPLAIDLCLSPRAAERLATAAQHFTAARPPQPDALLWPFVEAALAGHTITELPVGPRHLPVATADVFPHILQSLFAQVERNAAFWQRNRTSPASTSPTGLLATPVPEVDIHPRVGDFCRAYTSLHNTWSAVLPPQTLLDLKRLASLPPDAFIMADSLWIRIIYDFLLGWRLRTVPRPQLLESLLPIQAAWSASHLLLASKGIPPEVHIEAQARAFEAGKPYLISRWRWPDRFNP